MCLLLQDPSLDRCFQGHKDAVLAVDFSPNLMQIATGSADNYVIVWNRKPGLRAFRFSGHTDHVNSVNFSPSGHLIASASKDLTLRLWIPKIEGESTVFRAHSANVRSVRFSTDGTELISCSDDKSVKIWATHRRKFLLSLTQHVNWVRSANFSPDNRLVVSGSDDKTVKVWERRTGSCIQTFHHRNGFVGCVDFHPTGTCIGSSSSDGTVKLWDLRTNKLLQHYQAHEAGTNNISFHPSGNYLISSSTDSTVRVFDLVEGRLIYTLHGHKAAVNEARFSRCGTYFSSVGNDKQVLLWSTNFDQFDHQTLTTSHKKRTQNRRPNIDDIYPNSSIQTNKLPSTSITVEGRPPLVNQRDIPTAGRFDDVRCSGITSNPGQSVTELLSKDGGPTLATLQVTLEQAVGQIQLITQTLAMMEQRLTAVEHRLESSPPGRTHPESPGFSYPGGMTRPQDTPDRESYDGYSSHEVGRLHSSRNQQVNIDQFNQARDQYIDGNEIISDNHSSSPEYSNHHLSPRSLN